MKRQVALAVVLSLLLGLFAACAPSTADVAGTYADKDGKTLVLHDDGTYTLQSVADTNEEGIYQMGDGTITLVWNGITQEGIYNAANGTVDIHNTVYTKQ